MKKLSSGFLNRRSRDRNLSLIKCVADVDRLSEKHRKALHALTFKYLVDWDLDQSYDQLILKFATWTKSRIYRRLEKMGYYWIPTRKEWITNGTQFNNQDIE